MSSLISAQGTLTEADLLPIARYTVWNRSIQLRVLFCIGCFCIVASLFNLATGQLVTAIAPFFLGLFWTGYLFVLPKRIIRKQLRTSPFITELGAYEFDESQFTIARPSLKLSMSWGSVDSAVEMNDLFAIFTNKTCFYAVPKRFLTPDQVSAFRGLLEDVMQKRGKTFSFRGSRKSGRESQAAHSPGI